MMLISRPLLWWVRLVTIGITILLGLGYLKAWRFRRLEILRWKPAADLWILSTGQIRVELSLQTGQFVTAFLVILCFKTSTGKPCCEWCRAMHCWYLGIVCYASF